MSLAVNPRLTLRSTSNTQKTIKKIHSVNEQTHVSTPLKSKRLNVLLADISRSLVIAIFSRVPSIGKNAPAKQVRPRWRLLAEVAKNAMSALIRHHSGGTIGSARCRSHHPLILDNRKMKASTPKHGNPKMVSIACPALPYTP